jgi:hypothetical protein
MKNDNRRLDKKWCMYCKTFIVNNKPSLDMHEQGFRHKSQVRYYLKNTYRELDREKREQDRQKAEYKKIEKAALKQEQLRQSIPSSSTTTSFSYPTSSSDTTHYPQMMTYYDHYAYHGSAMYHQSLSGMNSTNLTYGYDSVIGTETTSGGLQQQQQWDSTVSPPITSTTATTTTTTIPTELSSSMVKQSVDHDLNIEERPINPKTHPYGEWVRVKATPNEDDEKESSNSNSADEILSAEEEQIDQPSSPSLNSSFEKIKEPPAYKGSETVTLDDQTSSPTKSDNLFKKRSVENQHQHHHHHHRRRHKIGWE